MGAHDVHISVALGPTDPSVALCVSGVRRAVILRPCLARISQTFTALPISKGTSFTGRWSLEVDDDSDHATKFLEAFGKVCDVYGGPRQYLQHKLSNPEKQSEWAKHLLTTFKPRDDVHYETSMDIEKHLPDCLDLVKPLAFHPVMFSWQNDSSIKVQCGFLTCNTRWGSPDSTDASNQLSLEHVGLVSQMSPERNAQKLSRPQVRMSLGYKIIAPTTLLRYQAVFKLIVSHPQMHPERHTCVKIAEFMFKDGITTNLAPLWVREAHPSVVNTSFVCPSGSPLPAFHLGCTKGSARTTTFLAIVMMFWEDERDITQAGMACTLTCSRPSGPTTNVALTLLWVTTDRPKDTSLSGVPHLPYKSIRALAWQALEAT